MPVESAFPSFEVPKEDIWAFLFERKDKDYPDDKSMSSIPNCFIPHASRPTAHQDFTLIPILGDSTPMRL
jgi:hypothetical protein